MERHDSFVFPNKQLFGGGAGSDPNSPGRFAQLQSRPLNRSLSLSGGFDTPRAGGDDSTSTPHHLAMAAGFFAKQATSSFSPPTSFPTAKAMTAASRLDDSFDACSPHKAALDTSDTTMDITGLLQGSSCGLLFAGAPGDSSRGHASDITGGRHLSSSPSLSPSSSFCAPVSSASTSSLSSSAAKNRSNSCNGIDEYEKPKPDQSAFEDRGWGSPFHHHQQPQQPPGCSPTPVHTPTYARPPEIVPRAKIARSNSLTQTKMLMELQPTSPHSAAGGARGGGNSGSNNASGGGGNSTNSNGTNGGTKLQYNQMFTTLALIGRGNFSEVYKVQDKRDHKLYAMKRSLHQFRSKRDVENYMQEMKSCVVCVRACVRACVRGECARACV
jgi:hypothetical protein